VWCVSHTHSYPVLCVLCSVQVDVCMRYAHFTAHPSTYGYCLCRNLRKRKEIATDPTYLHLMNATTSRAWDLWGSGVLGVRGVDLGF